MTFDAEPLFDSLLLTEQMPWWHNADIEQAKKKKKNRTDFSGRPCSHSFWKTTNLPWSSEIKSLLTRMSVASAVLLQVQSQTLRLCFDSRSWLDSSGALRALLELISDISQNAPVRALPRRILKASVSGPRRLEMSAKNRDPTVSYVTLDPDQNNDPSHSVEAGNSRQRPLSQCARAAPEAPSTRKAAVVLSGVILRRLQRTESPRSEALRRLNKWD